MYDNSDVFFVILSVYSRFTVIDPIYISFSHSSGIETPELE